MGKSHSSTVTNYVVSTRSCVLSYAVRCVFSTVLLTTSCAALLGPAPPVHAPKGPKLQLNPLRIHMGTEEKTNEFPFVVAILREAKIRVCTGTLIAPTWVLGTAHCQKGIHIQYGNMTLARGEINNVSAIIKYIIHPGYQHYKYFHKDTRYYNDIAMALVERVPVQYGKLSSLDYGTLVGLKVTYVGLGVSDYRDRFTVDNMKPRQYGFGVVASCRGVARELFYFPMICVASECSRPQSAMPGDSGGPLLLENTIIGVTVGILFYPRVTLFTPVSPYLSWIRLVMDQYQALIQ